MNIKKLLKENVSVQINNYLLKILYKMTSNTKLFGALTYADFTYI